MDKIADCNDKLEQKKSELEGLIGRRQSVIGDFDTVVPESDPFREPLSKIFHRKIKRTKKKAATNNDDDEDEDEDDEDEDDEEGDDEDDDGGEEVCPAGCDQGLYEKVGGGVCVYVCIASMATVYLCLAEYSDLAYICLCPASHCPVAPLLFFSAFLCTDSYGTPPAPHLPHTCVPNKTQPTPLIITLLTINLLLTIKHHPLLPLPTNPHAGV